MLRFTRAAALAVLAIMLLACVSAEADEAAQEDEDVQVGDQPSKVKVLTAENFEHLTQSVTGATTGDWFVKFYAPWCGHCKAMAQDWEALGAAMAKRRALGDGGAIIAKVDLSNPDNSYLASRFKVRGFPTLLLFSKGKMYTYNGERKLGALNSYARGGWTDEERDAIPVPKGPNEMDLVEKAIHLWNVTIAEDMKSIWKLHKAAFFAGTGAAAFVGLLLGFYIGRASKSSPPPVAAGKKKN